VFADSDLFRVKKEPSWVLDTSENALRTGNESNVDNAALKEGSVNPELAGYGWLVWRYSGYESFEKESLCAEDMTDGANAKEEVIVASWSKRRAIADLLPVLALCRSYLLSASTVAEAENWKVGSSTVTVLIPPVVLQQWGPSDPKWEWSQQCQLRPRWLVN
jgi:hypothetical protein